MLKTFERWFVVLMLFYLSSSLLGFVWPDSETSLFRPESSAALFAIQGALYGVTFLLIALRWKKFSAALFGARWVLALSLLAVSSAAWSPEPGLTFRRGMVLVGTTAFGIYLGSNFSLREQLRLITLAFGIMVVLSLLMVLALPGLGIDHEIHGGSWQGVFAQKNLLGKAMAVSIFAFLCAGASRRPVVRWTFIVASLLLAVMSNSLTSLAVIAVLFVLTPAYRLLRAKRTTSVPVVIVLGAAVAAVVALAVQHEEFVLQLLDRSISLTGRTGIWESVWQAISQRALLGYGFNGFWNGIGGASANIVLSLGFVAKHAHDGFLDLWLELGIVGLGLFVIGYLTALWRALHILANDNSVGSAWPMHYLAFMFFYHIPEGPILRQNSLYWALYTATVVYLAAWRWHAAPSVSTAIVVRENVSEHVREDVRESVRGNTVEPQPDYLPG